MRKRLTLTGVLVALMFVVGLFGASPASAAPSSTAASSTRAAVSVLQKVTLNESSANAVGFYGNANLGTGEVIAWAGTDYYHRINLMTSTDAMHWGHKVTLGDTTVNRPAVVRMSSSAGGAVAIAWRGTDPSHRLNVLFNVYGAQKKLTLSETSFTGPALTIFKGNLLLSWTGVDPNHSLNVLPISLSTFKPGVKTTLWQYGASAGPNLFVLNLGSTSTLVLSWATKTGHLDQATSTDGVHFTSALGSGLSYTSPSSPAMMYFQSEGGPEYWLAWTGTGTIGQLHVMWTSHFPQWTGSHTALPERALGGPQLGFDQGLLIAWTGVDPWHHLNVARLQGF